LVRVYSGASTRMSVGRFLQQAAAGNAGGLPDPFDLSTAGYDSVTFYTGSQAGNPRGLRLSEDGTKMYVADFSNEQIYQYSLSTADDVSTASYDSVFLTFSSQTAGPTGLHFNSDGTKMYLSGATSDAVYQYSLSTAWDLSTASYDSKSFSFATQDSNPWSVFINPEGTKMYVVGRANEKIFQYSLSTADDVSTASYDSVSFTPQKSASNVPVAVLFSSDGTKMYVINSDTSSTVYQYSLSTEFDLSTASYDSISLDVESQSQLMQAMAFTTDQTKMLLIDSTNDNVFQYS